jgi:hypothetical protein
VAKIEIDEWDRQPFESMLAYSYFCLCRDTDQHRIEAARKHQHSEFSDQLQKSGIHPEQYDRLEFPMAEEARVDYSQGTPTLHESGKYRRPRLFVMTLKY